MSYHHIIQRAAAEHFLHSVLLELTYRCNLDCYFCYNDLALQGRQLSVERYLDLLEELYELQVMVVALSGGEPLASPAFWPVGRRARELGFVVRVKSNGHALGSLVARRLKDEIDPHVVEVSLHGARAETHDRQTQVPGSFERLMENLEAMGRAGLGVRINSTLTRWNEGEVQEMLAIADRLKLPLTFDPVVTPRDDGDRAPMAIAATDAGIENLFKLLRARGLAEKSRSSSGASAPEKALATIGRHGDLSSGGTGKNCGSGSSTLTIDPFGNVYPCVQWRRSLGSLHEGSVREIWEGSAAIAEVRRINGAVGASGAAGRKPATGFCMGLAEELTGDPMGSYAEVERKERIWEKVKGEGADAGAARPASSSRLPIVG